MTESKHYFLYLLLGGQGIKNLRSTQLPSNVRIHDFLLLNKHGDKYVVVTFEADSEEDANQFAKFLSGFKTVSKSGYLLPGCYKVQKIEQNKAEKCS